MQCVHETAGLRQFTTNENSVEVQVFTKPPHMCDIEIVSLAIYKVLWSNHPWMGEIWRCFNSTLTDEPPAPDTVIEMGLCKLKTGCSTMQCKCQKNSLVCVELFLRTVCKNVPFDENLERPIVHDDDGQDNGM